MYRQIYTKSLIPESVVKAINDQWRTRCLADAWRLAAFDRAHDCLAEGYPEDAVAQAIASGKPPPEWKSMLGQRVRRKYEGTQVDEGERLAAAAKRGVQAAEQQDKFVAERRACDESWKRVFAFTNALSDAEFEAATRKVRPTLPISVSGDPRRNRILCSSIKRLLESEATP